MHRFARTASFLAFTLLALCCSAVAQSVTIVQPLDGAIVRGVLQITGTTTGLATGGVAISIDSGPFQIAQGLSSWSFAWDTTTVGDGPHTIRARARASATSPPVFDLATVDVQNVGAPSISITGPADGTTVSNTFVLTGTSTGATVVEVAVDTGAFQPVNGVDQWITVFEPGSIAPGPHTLTARATAGALVVFDSIGITVGDPLPGTQSITYVSSVDGEPLTAVLRVPPGLDPTVPAPLFVYLHGGGGTGAVLSSNATLLAELDARGWIGLAPDGRAWGLAAQGCSWQTSAAYVDNPDPAVGPGERDILDAIDFVSSAFAIDPDRVYLAGFSMGGRGAYTIGLRNPDRFAAIAPLGPAIDMYEIFERRPEPAVCKEGMVGGQPGTSLFVDTMYSITSARFLIENAFGLPVFHGHGLVDVIATNTVSNAPFLHGWHIVSDGSWSSCHGTSSLCFGHTPTLTELRTRHPEGYDFAFCFTDVGHLADPFWFTGGPPPTAAALGTPDPAQPGDLLGVFDFMAARSRVASPPAIVFKTYTDTHDKAWWLRLTSSRPWQDAPAAVRATRDIAANRVDVELVRAAVLTIDAGQAGLQIAVDQTLTVALQELVEPVFDPALVATGELLAPTIVVRGDFSALDWVTVSRDGVPLATSVVGFSADEITIGPIDVTGPTELAIVGGASFVDLGQGTAGAAGVPALTGVGATAPGEAFALLLTNGVPSGIGVVVVGFAEQPVQVLGITLVPTVDILMLSPFDGSGTGVVPLIWPQAPPGASLAFQVAMPDVGGPLGFAASNALRAVGRP